MDEKRFRFLGGHDLVGEIDLRALQNARVMIEMIVDEGRYEIVAMIVASMAPKGQRLAYRLTGSFKQMRMQLHFKKFVG